MYEETLNLTLTKMNKFFRSIFNLFFYCENVYCNFSSNFLFSFWVFFLIYRIFNLSFKRNENEISCYLKYVFLFNQIFSINVFFYSMIIL